MSGKTQQDMDDLLARAKQLSTSSDHPTIDSIRQTRAQAVPVPVAAAPTSTAAIPGLSPTPDRSVIGSGSGPSTTTGAPTATTGTSAGGAPASGAPTTGTSAFSDSATANTGTGTSSASGSGGKPPTSAAAAAQQKMARADSDFGEYEWLSDLMGKMWPYVTKAVTKEAQAQLPGLLKTSKPTWMGDIVLHKFELGGEPPKLSDIKVVKQEGEKELSGDDLIYIEADFDWVSQQDVEMDISPLPEKISYVPGFISKAVSKMTSFRCGVEDFSMHGQLRITLRPMLNIIPVIAAVQVSLIETPEFDFTITFGADDKPLKLFPSLKSWMYSFICDTLLAAYVLPDHYFYALDPTAPDFNIPVGIIECTVVECKNVPKMDIIGSTTAYVELATHKRGAAQTNLKDGKTPVWDETYSLPVHVKEHQKLTAIMYDQDVGADDEIGRAIVSLKDLRPDQVVDIWVPVKPLMEQDSGDDKKQGPTRKREKLAAMVTSPLQPKNPSDKGTELHLRLQYRDLTVAQTQMVINSQRNNTPIPDERLRKLLEEAKPANAPAADFSAKPALGDEPTPAQKNAEAR